MQYKLQVRNFIFVVLSLAVLSLFIDYHKLMSVDIASPSISFHSSRRRQKRFGHSKSTNLYGNFSSYHCYDAKRIPATPFNTTQFLMNVHLRSPLPPVLVLVPDKENPSTEVSVPLEQYGSMMEVFEKANHDNSSPFILKATNDASNDARN